MPETVSLTISRPAEFAELSADDFRNLLTSRVEAVEAAAKDKRYTERVGCSGGSGFSTKTGATVRAATSLAVN
jgi:hypothetical protein